MSYATQLIPARPAPPFVRPPISRSRIIGLFGLALCALLLAAQLIGSDLLVDGLLQRQDLSVDALGLVVEQLACSKVWRLLLLAQGLEGGAQGDQLLAGLARFLVTLGGGQVKRGALELVTQLGEASFRFVVRGDALLGLCRFDNFAGDLWFCFGVILVLHLLNS